MEWLAVHAFAIAFWASIFWGSLWLVDRGNVKNTFGLAVLLAAIFDVTHFAAIPDVFYLIIWLIFLLRIVLWHYELGLLRAVIVTGSTVLAPYFIIPQLIKFIGDSELRDYLVLYGLPIVVFGTWLVTSLRGRGRANEPVHDEASGLPAAWVKRGGRTRAAKQPVAALPVASAPVVAAPSAAPPAPTPPRSDGGPTFLT